MTVYEKYVDAWLRYQHAKTELDALKTNVIKKLGGPKQASGYVLTVRERPVFTHVTLETARKYDAVKKVVNTTLLLKYLKEGKDIKGVDYTKYVYVQPTV